MKIAFCTIGAFLAAHLASSAAPRIVISTPSLTPESTIDLVLDSPAVAPLQLGTKVENTWLKITPALPGKLLWKAQNIANFVPEQPITIGTTYTFALQKGCQLLDGTTLPSGKITALPSEPFRVQFATAQDRWSSDYSPSSAECLIVFNDAVDPASASAFISFTSESGQKIAAHLDRPPFAKVSQLGQSYPSWSARGPLATPAEHNPESLVINALIARPVSPLPVGKRWVINTLNGLPNQSTTATLAEDGVFEIGDVVPFQTSAITPQISPNVPRHVEISFNQPLPEKIPDDFLSSALEILPRPENLSATLGDRKIHLHGDFSKNDQYTITVKPPFASRAGLILEKPFTQKIEFKHLDPGIALPSETQAQLASGTRIYPIETVNLSSIRIRIKKLTDSNLIRAFEGFQNYTGQGHNGKSIQATAPLPFSLVLGETVYQQEIPLGNPIDTSKKITLAWSDILPPDLANATLFLDITGTPHPEAPSGTRSAQAIVQLTDIGLAWKLTPSDALIYAFSCRTGKPLPGVNLQLFGEDARPLGAQATDAAGILTLPRQPDARHLRASLGNDTYLTAFDSTLATVGLWHFPIRYSWNKSPMPSRKVFLFTDRSLYRPGETVKIKGIIRQQIDNEIQLAPHTEARIVVLDPLQNEIHSQTIAPSPSGSFDVSYTLPLSKTGTHLIRLEYPQELAHAAALEDDWEQQDTITQNALFTLPLRVEEFRRNAFEITQTILPAEPGTTSITANLSAAYYQGQPTAAAKVNHYTHISATNPYPERFRDFQFGNHRADDWSYWFHYFGYNLDDNRSSSSHSTDLHGETTLSPEGTATFSLALPQADFPTAHEITLSSEVTDSNNQTLTARTTSTTHPSSVYIGISRNDRLVRIGEPLPLKIVAIDTAGEPFKGAIKATATLTREIHSTLKSRTDTGATTTRDEVTEETVSTSEITLDPAASAAQGTALTLLPTAAGRHYLTLRGTDPEGRPFATTTYFHAYGTDQYPWLYEDGMRVKLVAEKKSYHPGETARLLVLSPIEGTALVTIEREKVLRSFQVELRAENPVIEIPLTQEDAPNTFVSVLIVKGAQDSARQHKQPQLRLGYCELTVENLRDTLTVEITPESTQSCRPGDEITLHGTVLLADGTPTSAAEVTLYAVDEGTLAVMGYETPNPIPYFYSPRLLDVDTGTSLESFISEDLASLSFHNKGFFIGGGGDSEALPQYLRKDFDPCATWAPALVTDAVGRFQHTFKVPDTLTRYRIIAIAHHSATRFGHAEAHLTVKKDLMLEPKAPRFAHQGDTFDAQVLVQNASTHSGTWEVHYTTQNGTQSPAASPQGPTTQTLTLAAGASATLVFPTRADATGEAILTWKATPVSLSADTLTPALTARLSDAVQSSFPIHYPMPLIRQNRLVSLNTPGATQNLAALISPSLLEGSGNIELEFATSPLIEASNAIDFLLSYPHGCLEQTTSALLPWLTVSTLAPAIPRLATIPEEKIEQNIQAGVNRLLSMQLPDGSFSYWPGNLEPVPWASSYAGLALILAAENGADVPESALTNLKSHLAETLRGLHAEKSPTVLEMHTRTLFVLTLAGLPQHAYLSALQDRLTELSPSARALLAAALCIGEMETPENQSTARKLLTSKVPFKSKHDEWMPWTPQQAYQLIAWTAADPTGDQPNLILEKMLQDRSPYGDWRTTWVNGWSLIAMAAYADHQNLSDRPSTIQLQISDTQEKIHLSSENPTALHTLPITPDLQLLLTADAPAFVRLKVAAKPKIAPLQPVANNGLALDRTYERILPDGSAEILTNPKPGDLIRVSLRLSLPTDQSRYLAIEDPLPAIFETVNTEFKSQNSAAIGTSERNWQVSHSELRTDRAVFYLDHLPQKGTYTVTYLARCTLAGIATAPPAKAETMYDPENFALSASRTFHAH